MTKERVMEIMDRQLYIGSRIAGTVICGKETVADNILDELDKPKFSFQAIKPEATEDEMTYKWAIKETSFPLTQEYAILKPFVDFLEEKCKVEKAEIFLDYYLGYITTENSGMEKNSTQEEYPDTITAVIFQDFEEYVIGMDYMNNKWRRELRTIIMQYLKDRV